MQYKSNTLLTHKLMNTSLSFLSLHHPGTKEEISKERSKSDTTDIRKEIKPVAATMCRTKFLQKFNRSTHKDRTQDCPDPGMPKKIVVFTMIMQKLKPQHTGQPGVHTNMRQLVYPHNPAHLQRRRLKEREIDHDGNNR